MPTPVIVGAARTAIGRSFKGTLVNTPPETLITTVLPEVVRRSGVDPADIAQLRQEVEWYPVTALEIVHEYFHGMAVA